MTMHRARRITVILILALVFATLLAGRADAEPRIKTGCRLYDTNREDAIAHADHLHRQIGNTSHADASTGNSLFAHTPTSCKAVWLTAAGWFPAERYEPVQRVGVYYRAPGDQTTVRAIPKGLQLLGNETQYRCNDTAGEEPFQDSPPYGCRTDFDTKVSFPDSWNRKSKEATLNREPTTVDSNNGVCPAAYPYRIPKINYLIQHDNADGRVANPLTVSAGVSSWEPWGHTHADYVAANQPIFNGRLIDLCLRNAPDDLSGGVGQPDACGVGVRE